MKNLRIKTQMTLGHLAVLFFVIVIGIVSYLQISKTHQQAETLYNHPLQVRRAIGELQSDIYMIHWSMETLFEMDGMDEMNPYIELIRDYDTNAQEQFNILFNRYLGSMGDVEHLFHLYSSCKANRDQVFSLLKDEDYEKALLVNIHKHDVLNSSHLRDLKDNINRIDNFARSKADEVFISSEALNKRLSRDLILLIAAVLLLSFGINFILYLHIRDPLDILTETIHLINSGKLSARSRYGKRNEFGILSDAFNNMAENVQENIEQGEKFSTLASQMLSEADPVRFFNATLNTLASMTGAHIAAVYILSEDKKRYEHFYSIGTDGSVKNAFEAEINEGEFGTAISSGKIQYIKDIQPDARFQFHTVTGKFMPREIITIPVFALDDVIVLISLGSISKFNQGTLKFLEKMLDTLSARVAGVVAYRKIKELSVQLSLQNNELEMQKKELAAQSSELLEQNTELEMQKVQLNEANRLKTIFLSNMSHELRTPLNSVIALSGVLSRRLAGKINEEEYSYLEVVERNGKNLLALINDILNISRIEAGKEEIEVSEFNINDLITEIITILEPQLKNKKIEIIFSGSDTTVNVRSDNGKCRHILQNLIGNAVKFTEKGKVEIIVKEEEEVVGITVIDTGIGISHKHLPHIFDEFRQADSSASRRFGGTGLGLAIAKKYVNLLGGTIEVESTPGKGSEFTFTMPLEYDPLNTITEHYAFADVQPRKFQVSGSSIQGTNGKTLLLVEDNEAAIIQITDILEDSGYKILLAREGNEALSIITHIIPDAIILDLMMPGMNGFDVLIKIREEDSTAHIPVLILSAKHVTSQELSLLKRNNIYQLIQKGNINPEELRNAVAEMVMSHGKQTKPSRQGIKDTKEEVLVLLVEDNPDNMLTLKALLRDKYRILEAADGNEAVAITKKHHPDIILMDIALPEMDGVDALKAIRGDPKLPYTVVIALTSSVMEGDRETILAYGFDAYIPKPINEKIFFQTINQTVYGK